jgi:cystathionine beta-lyase/cystathionine gamma-synthase
VTEFGTRVVHAGLEPDPSYGSVIPAIHQSSTYVQPAPGRFVEDYDYSRAANPTRRALENALGELEGGHGSAFASGMAATHALLTAACSAGDHVVIPDDLYGGTYRLVDKILARFGLAYDMVDQTDLEALRAALRPETRLVWVETPTNPTLGAVPGPLDCFLVHRGLRTLHLRMAAHAENGLAVSAFLRDQPGVSDVRWPGFSGMVCFRHPEAVKIVAATKLFALAESLGGVESLIEVPQAMTHQSVEGSSAAVPPDLVRVSCGIEAAVDLVEDLRQAIAAVTPAGVTGT